MKKSELVKIIREEYKKTLTESVEVKKALDIIKYLGAEEMELLTRSLSKYYRDNADKLNNMDAKGISKLFYAIAEKLNSRTGN